MKKFMVIFFAGLFLCLPLVAQAKVVVLVHGYLGNAYSWESSHVLQTLRADGYQHMAIMGYSPNGLLVQSFKDQEVAIKHLYSVNLPSQTGLLVQSDWLSAYLAYIFQQHPSEAITLVAHSAGGVVARLALIRYQPKQVKWLITIATPHQGTGRTYQALAATDSGGWFGGMKSWFVRREIGNQLYYTLKRSRNALLDLSPPRQGNLLHWLNQQPHPDIRYTSVIRIGTRNSPGDLVVPPFSQDLCLLPQVASYAERYFSQQGHLLSSKDGVLLSQLLRLDSSQVVGLQQCVAQ